MKLFNFVRPNDKNKTFCVYVVTTNGFALNHEKMQIYFFCLKRQAKKKKRLSERFRKHSRQNTRGKHIFMYNYKNPSRGGRTKGKG